MRKILVIPLLLVALTLSAAPIGEKRAREIATSFFSKSSTRSTAATVELAWAGEINTSVVGKFNASSATNIDESLLYIYNRTDAKGHIVIAGDDSLRSIIAFSHEGCLDMDNIPDGVRFMLSSWSKQVAAAREGRYTVTRVAGADDIGEVVVKYNTALWNQSEPFNDKAPVYDGNRCVTGCVATALSIICKYNEWPKCGTGTTSAYTYTDDYGVSHQISANTLGHSYDYANMRNDNYTSGYTQAEADAVATLMRDIGYGVQMKYHYTGSGAYDANALYGMVTYFGYMKSAKMEYGVAYSETEWVEALKANISEHGPTYFSGVDYGRNDVHVGHAFVLDGYTTGGYISINYGWGGSGNAYYLIPNIDYMNQQKSLMGMSPDRSGSSQYADNLSYISLYDNNGVMAYGGLATTDKIEANKSVEISYGGILNSGMAAFNGYYRIVHCDKTGSVQNVLLEESLSLDSQSYTYGRKVITLRTPIAVGDRIIIQYRNANSQEWKSVLRSDDICSQAIMLSATPEYVAEQLSVSCRRENDSRYILFILPDTREYKMMSYTITDANGVAKMSGNIEQQNGAAIDASALASGEYTVAVSLCGEPYEFILAL